MVSSLKNTIEVTPAFFFLYIFWSNSQIHQLRKMFEDFFFHIWPFEMAIELKNVWCNLWCDAKYVPLCVYVFCFSRKFSVCLYFVKNKHTHVSNAIFSVHRYMVWIKTLLKLKKNKTFESQSKMPGGNCFPRI